jgi:hypothetical protein
LNVLCKEIVKCPPYIYLLGLANGTRRREIDTVAISH